MTSKTKTILGISLAAVFAVSAMTSMAMADDPPPPTWRDLIDAKITEQGNGNKILYSAYTERIIPHVPDMFIDENLVVGVAWLDENFNFSGATIHPEAVDSRQNPFLWHPHTGNLISVDEDQNGNPIEPILCVENLQSPNAGISIVDNMINVNMNARDAVVDANNVDFAAVFTLASNDNCDGIDVELPGKGFPPASANGEIVPNLPGLEVTVISTYPVQ